MHPIVTLAKIFEPYSPFKADNLCHIHNYLYMWYAQILRTYDAMNIQWIYEKKPYTQTQACVYLCQNLLIYPNNTMKPQL